MSEVQTVLVQLHGSSGEDPGRITEGFYTLDGDKLVMTYADGRPVDEYMFRAALKDGGNPKSIAGLLTKDVRLHIMGLTKEQDAFFSRPMNYGPSGVA